MPQTDYLTNAAVLGAAGKMGSGIALLLLQEMANSEAANTSKVGEGKYKLTLIDENAQALEGLKKYLQSQLQKNAEKGINAIRKYFPNLTNDQEIINNYVNGAMKNAFFASSSEEAKNSDFIFEAIIEDVDLKAKVFRNIVEKSKRSPYFFTNTSSIPIATLNQKGGLQNKIIGFHFYNPPPVQKLLEVIPMEGGDSELNRLALDIAKRLNKVVVISKDVAGFIGNGYLVREIMFACSLVHQLHKQYTLHEAIYMVNKVTQDFLVRPMGIFQLLDYVGLDVAQKIGTVMNHYLSGIFQDDLIANMLNAGVKGGQYPDGSQKDGFFQYRDHQIAGIYRLDEKRYIPIGGEWQAKCDKALGQLPKDYLSWKVLAKDPESKEKVHQYLENLTNEKTFGAELARTVLNHSNEIANQLVEDGVAKNIEDVNTVLKNGFYHLYGVRSFTKR